MSEETQSTPTSEATLPGPTSTEEEEAQLLDLSAQERTVRLKIGPHRVLHILRRLTLQDWIRYQKTAHTQVIVSGEWSQMSSRSDEAAIELWDSAIVRIEGYKVGPGGLPVDWKNKMSVLQKIRAVDLLQEVEAVPESEQPAFEANSRSVCLEAGWNGTIYEHLMHKFRLPTQEDDLKYRRVQADSFRKRERSRQRNGRREAVTKVLLPSILGTMSEFYDQFILEVAGYTGAQHVADMDPLHKQAAIMALFDPPTEESEDDE